MKKAISVVLVLALGLASVSPAAEGTWTTKTPMPTRRYVLSSSVVDGKIYAIGGDAGSRASVVEAYDPATDTWTRKANMPMGRGAGASSVVNGRIYYMGGRLGANGANISSVIEYDPMTDTWATKASMLTARTWLSSSVVNGKIYVMGGALTYQGTAQDTALSTVEEYDPATDTWTSKADMPTPRACVSTSAVNGKIYAIGGSPGTPWYQGLTTVEEYDPATDTWTRKADMPTGRTYISTCAVNGKIYAIGGVRSGGADHVSQVEEYDPATDTWTTKADIPTARSGVATSAVNGKIYAIGGWVGTGSPISTVEEYDPPKPLIIDFNGDQKVDFNDFAIFAQSAYDDGELYGKGLAALAEHWLEDFRLIARWTLDETEGTVTHDSVGENDGTLNGSPVWQATSGKIDGALRFDGIDDYVHTDSPLGPMDLSLSVFAWIKGGAPGQVIISEPDRRVGRFIEPGSTWLGTDPSDGRLMTKLLDPLFGPLESDSVITDGRWHHVGLVYDFDGFHRRLYVDGAEVAKDTDVVAGLLSDGVLYFGAGKDLDAGSFFSGMIDDVRIYNRALSAEEIEELAR
jgi:N-acetylneuraminic acid mutarotase